MNKLGSNVTGVQSCHVSHEQTTMTAEDTKHIILFWSCKTRKTLHKILHLYFSALREEMVTFLMRWKVTRLSYRGKNSSANWITTSPSSLLCTSQMNTIFISWSDVSGLESSTRQLCVDVFVLKQIQISINSTNLCQGKGSKCSVGGQNVCVCVHPSDER